MHFSLIIPLWNEERNVDQLISSIDTSGLINEGLHDVILVNNGSQDRTAVLIDRWAQKFSWIMPVHLKENLNYGGGVWEGFQHAHADVLCYLPGDNQYSMDDLKKIWMEYQKLANEKKSKNLLLKGHRTVRKDGWDTRLVSKIYTFLANLLLQIKVRDVNGLPKIFHKDLLRSFPEEKMKTFVFDIQLIYTARRKHWDIREVPVTFYARREGVSSWSGKRINTYWNTFSQMIRLRHMHYR